MEKTRTGKVVKVNANMVTAEVAGLIIQNEVAYIVHGQERLKAEVIRVRQNQAEMQVYESTQGLKVGDIVEFSNELLSVELGPGLLGQIFDGLQNPLPALAQKCGLAPWLGWATRFYRAAG
jgi:V/A-type H+-transporting ATPase subunit A